MSSSPPANPARRRGSPATWPLRTQLLVGQVILLALVCLAIGTVTELALRHYLVNQLDEELREVSHRSTMMAASPALPEPPRHSRRQQAGPGPEFLDAAGQPAGLIAAVVPNDGQVAAGSLDSHGARHSLSDDEVAQLAAVIPSPAPTTVPIGDRGQYRVIATTTPKDDVVVTGLPLADINNTMWTALLIMTVVALGALLAAATLGAAITRRALAPLHRVAATAREVVELPLDRGEVILPVRVPEANADPNTEIGQMGSALNRMLDHIGTALATRQASESRARQFVADASHELRTPLAAIRGYTELSRRRRDDVPDEVAHAMGRVQSESDRMTHLVEDLLLLARLDSGRPLEREQVDLSNLAVDAVSDAHVAGPDHIWNLDLPDEPVVVVGDGARLHQVLANLLGNARVHTPPGSTVTVELTSTADRAALRVTDDGPGIDSALQSEVFTRFARGDTSRSRKAGSTGLGLSIVDAVVKAHGGTIALRSRPGATEFTVSIPVDASA